MTTKTQVLDNVTEKALLWLLLPLFFLPKVNLITFGGGETAGVRIDDVFLLGFSLFFGFAAGALRKPLSSIEKGMFALIFLSLLSFAFNRLLYALDTINVNASIFYALRPLEYFLFFYIGQMTYRRASLRAVMLAILFANALVMGLQWFELLPAVSVDGFMYVSGRIPGISSFPSEMGAILNLIFCYLLFSDSFEKMPFKEIMPYAFFIFIGGLVLMTASRASLVAHVVAFIVYLKTCATSKQAARFSLGLIILMIAGGMLMLILPHIEELYERSMDLFSWSNFELIEEVWHHIETSHNPLGNESVEFEEGLDMSWWIRIHKWCYALKIFTMYPECYLQGIGPGFASAGLDGGILRILVELGSVGSVLYIFFFSNLMKLSPYVKWMVIVLLMNMVFFDAHLAYKPMSLLFFAAGFAFVAKSEQDSQNRINIKQ